MTERPFEEDIPLDPSGESEVFGGGAAFEPAESAIQRLSDQLRDSQEKYLRLAADFDNFKKRVARERVNLADKAQAAFVIKLLDVLDDLDRLSAADPAGPVDVLRQGVELVDRKLRKDLEAAGLERVDPVGQRFDPSVSEAVSVVPALDAAADHTVSATFQVGYRFKGALVRPARVQVYSTEGHA